MRMHHSPTRMGGWGTLLDMLRITLRLLLVLSLVLGGIGNAMAAVDMRGTLAGSADAALGVSHGALPLPSACDHSDGEPVGVTSPGETRPASDLADCDEGCCAQLACSCTCVQIVQAALRDLAVLPMPTGSPLVFAVMPWGNVAPVPLEPMRPPIG